MKKLLIPIFCALFVTGLAGYASAHCGTCGTGGDHDKVEKCKEKCADAEDKAACEKK